MEASNETVEAVNTQATGENEALLTPEAPGAAADTKAQEGADGGDKPLLNPEGDEQKEADGAPEAYESFKMPEGFTLEGEELEKATGLFKDLGLSQANAQKLVDAYTERILSAKEKELSELASKQKAWRAEVRSKPDFAVKQALAAKGMRALLTDDASKAMFTGTWLASNPVFFELFARAGKLVSEDVPLAPGGQKEETNVNLLRFPQK